ncbi:DUF4111 domain-containing protein [Paenibacillus sp. N1-5-1-14]|uniref:nucleotidyltransferase domain-containing protein n=1 Tax=Paenibacillus radicibacter TaxID=2972488 RepID=UPI002159927D|nr:nucleotidyltransferase domain-containing protein [Paenibacillus radicibacter]MCR8644407.1 DUF4111 domain-containing protein [Paenibacillus radicibacter]
MLPQVVDRVMQKLSIELSKTHLSVESIYLYGSVALGDYKDGSSDIDFLVLLKEAPQASDIDAISAAHQEVDQAYPHLEIMGTYLHLEDVGKPTHEQSSIVTYFSKQVHADGKGADMNPITWWILKHHGVRVYGVEQSFDYEVDEKVLVDYVLHNMNSYWVGWIERLESQLANLHLIDQESVTQQLDETVEWCVLGMLRQLYTVKEKGVKSKTQAGTYGLSIMPKQWHGLIEEAIHIKRQEPERNYISNEKRLTDLIELLRYIHQVATP